MMTQNILIFKVFCMIIYYKNSNGQIVSSKVTGDKNVALTEL